MSSEVDPHPQLLDALLVDRDVEPGSIRTGTDRTLAIGRDVVRLTWRGETATAVAGDADLASTCGALVDAVMLHEQITATSDDHRAISVLVHRPPPDREEPTETDQALRSLRDAVPRPRVRIWYREGTAWVEDDSPAPTFANDTKVVEWVQNLLLPRLHTAPTALAQKLVEALNDPSLSLYPSEIKLGIEPRWSLRLDGLEIGTVGETFGTLAVGGKASTGEGPQRSAFIDVAGKDQVAFTLDGASGTVSVTDAAGIITKLIRRWRGHGAHGAPVTHRHKNGVPFVDEHALEARLLKGIIDADIDGERADLVLHDQEVARGSQFPTLWGRGANPRYLDAMLAVGRAPIAMELKVATGGQGRYYRRALVQAALYRHFILHAPQLDDWFRDAGLERTRLRTYIGLPLPGRRTPSFDAMVERLRATAARFDLGVLLLDDRQTPDRPDDEAGDDPPAERVEYLSLRLAGALSRRWPKELGQVLQRHDQGGGQYDELLLLHSSDREWGPPGAGVQISMNRNGSLWLWNALGQSRWVWRGVWRYLHETENVDGATEVIGTMAGLPKAEATDRPTLGSVATAFLDAVPDGTAWTWRCAVRPGDDPVDLSTFQGVVSRYACTAPGNRVPTIARIWCALLDGQPRVIVDQQNLRIWVKTPDGSQELMDGDVFDRIRSAAARVAG